MAPLVLLAFLAAFAHADKPDPSCSRGVAAHGVCCSSQCGSCGGKGCSARPGGAVGCCGDSIEKSGRSCSKTGPPCIIDGPPPPPAPPGPSPPRGISVDVDGRSLTARVAAEYVSFNLDTSQLWRVNLSSPALVTLAKALLPAHLRVGGTQADYNVYAYDSYRNFDCSHPPAPMTSYRCRIVTPAMWEELLEFSEQCGASLVFGLSDLFGRPTKTKPEKKLCSETSCPPRNLSNAAALLRWTSTHKPSALWGLELGKCAKPPLPKPACLDSNPVGRVCNVWAAGPRLYRCCCPCSAHELLLHACVRACVCACGLPSAAYDSELNSCLNGKAGAKAQADDFYALSQLVESLWPDHGTGWRPVLIGPDTHSGAEFSQSGLDWFDTFVATSRAHGDVVKHYTFHMYSMGSGPKLDPRRLDASFLNADALNKCGEGARKLAALAALKGAGRLWAGETAAANSGGQSGITDTFIDGFWYLDQLGTLAQNNITVFQRQVFVSTGGYPMIESQEPPLPPLLPLPDYWVAVMYSRLMGRGVLRVSSPDPELRVYAHCSKLHTSQQPHWRRRTGVYMGEESTTADSGDVALAFLNIGQANLTLSFSSAPKAWTAWVLTSGKRIVGAPNRLQSREALLNGKLLALGANGELPSMRGREGTAAEALIVPPTSYGYVVLHGVVASACKIQEDA
jgi:hypothetical protein